MRADLRGVSKIDGSHFERLMVSRYLLMAKTALFRNSRAMSFAASGGERDLARASNLRVQS